MEAAMAIRTPKVDDVLLYRSRRKRAKALRGTLFLTATCLIFREPSGSFEQWASYMLVYSVKKKPQPGKGVLVCVTLKDFRTLDFLIASEPEALDVYSALATLSFPKTAADTVAFTYQPDYDYPGDGWATYDPFEEYKRMGISPDKWKLSTLNMNYDLCPTYTSILCFPAEATDKTIQGSARFRSKKRLPVLSVLAKNGASLCRCAQPMSGVGAKRSKEDEDLVEAIRRTNPNQEQPLIIVDTRPKVNAIANKAKGKGYENMEGYEDCKLVFHGIQNIHAMRESLQGLLKAVRETEEQPYLSSLDSCSWLRHIRAVLDTTSNIVKYICDGSCVLVHCSDGWDRTAQTCSLAALLLDPYYRTIDGFIVLVEKEWLGFGHKFSDRNALVGAKSKENSPIFLQFLECAWQLSQQKPRAFEFNELFLVTLHDCLHSSQFGTFLENCERERKDAKLGQNTHSVWAYILSRRDDFVNPLYNIGEPAHQGVLMPDLSPQRFDLWTTMYCRWNRDIRPNQKYVQRREAALSHLQQELEIGENRLRVLQAKLRDAEAAAKRDAETKGSAGLVVPPPLEDVQTVSKCHLCATDFLYLAFKRYCRQCGHIFCSRCARTTVDLPEYLARKPGVVCSSCLKGRRKRTQANKAA